MDRSAVIKLWLRDSAIGYFLIIFGFTIAGLLAQWFQTNNSVAYSLFLCIGETPFAWYAGKRLGYLRPWAYVALVAFVVAAAGVRVLCEQFLPERFASVAMLIFTGCLGWFTCGVHLRTMRKSGNDSASQ
jgi:hypothetical protein